MSRFARQMILPQVGPAGQEKIANAHIAIVGAGGLGVPALQYLAAAGVAQITLVDPDVVSESNLHRQPIYGGQLGRLKIAAAADFLRALNPAVRLHLRPEWLTPANGPALVAGADLVLDCADSFAVSYILSDLCFAAKKPLFSASALGLAGYVGGFCGGAPSLRAVFPDLPDRLATCATAGVLGPVVASLGLAQAQMALSHLLGLAPSPLGLCLNSDWARFHFSSFRFDGAPEPAQAHQFIAENALCEQDLVIDLRGTDEVSAPCRPDALRQGFDDLSPAALAAQAQSRVVFACRSGLRAWRAADLLRPLWGGEIRLLAIPQPEESPI